MTATEKLQKVNSAEYLQELKDNLFQFVCYGIKNGTHNVSAPERRALKDALDVLCRLTETTNK